jgi:hypothetical protein
MLLKQQWQQIIGFSLGRQHWDAFCLQTQPQCTLICAGMRSRCMPNLDKVVSAGLAASGQRIG